MNIRFLETFLWLARLQSVRLTAAKLHATHAAVSNRISSLEESLGERLFDRVSGKMVLTPAGRTLLVYAERIVHLEEQMHERVGNADAGRDRLRVGVADIVLHSWFPELSALLRRRFPKLEMDLTSTTASHLLSMLRSDALDVVFHADEPFGGDSISTSLCEFALVWVASPAMHLGGGALTIAKLATHKLISSGKNTRLYAALQLLLASELDRLPPIHSIDSILGMIRLASEGFGVALLPQTMVQQELDSGTLQRLTVTLAATTVTADTSVPSLEIFAAHRPQADPRVAEIVTLARRAARGYLGLRGEQLTG